jgi:hypothetical protein
VKLSTSTQLEAPANETVVSLDELIRLRDEARIRFEHALNMLNRAEAAAARAAFEQAAAAVSAHRNPSDRRRRQRSP